MKVDANPFFASPLLLTKLYPLPELNLQMIPWFIEIENGCFYGKDRTVIQ